MGRREAAAERHVWMAPEVGGAELVRYGHTGVPLIYVPSSSGDQHEFARYGMPEVCSRWIDAGRVQLFSIDGRARQTYWNDGLSPAGRIRGYVAFERRLVEHLLPWIQRHTGARRVAVVGASYGAIVAANLLLKHAAWIDVACGLGGVYGLWHRLDGYHDDDVYFHTPLEYLPRLQDAAILEGIRRTRGLVLLAAEEDEWLGSSQRMAAALSERRLPHDLEVWSAPANHHERWWRRQLSRFLEGWL